MSKIMFFILFTTLFGNQTNYWNLGLSITDKSKRVIKKDIQINNIVAEKSHILNKNTKIYTLDKSYIIEPQKHENITYEEREAAGDEYFKDIKTLISNNEYFEAAKKIVEIDKENIEKIFNDDDDFYYNSCIIYYNLGNMEEAKYYIQNISDRENNPELILLEALILRDTNSQKSKYLLENLIKYFPDDDYADYAAGLLKDNQWIIKESIYCLF